ncbi:hypothetical protein PR048_033577 [Dryococelus australis]|uniref:Uncharacterized protein n=1 Tax=Dryococelus australis TaxID=614101 RepID=A0ABQ9G3X6_9NEOP|nr:hypothetical protein PR048_033577 [Dryococelus australis]
MRTQSRVSTETKQLGGSFRARPTRSPIDCPRLCEIGWVLFLIGYCACCGGFPIGCAARAGFHRNLSSKADSKISLFSERNSRGCAVFVRLTRTRQRSNNDIADVRTRHTTSLADGHPIINVAECSRRVRCRQDQYDEAAHPSKMASLLGNLSQYTVANQDTKPETKPRTPNQRMGKPTSKLLACSPLTKANRVGRCRWSAGFLGDLPFPPPVHSSAAQYSPSSALKTPPKSLHSLYYHDNVWGVEDSKSGRCLNHADKKGDSTLAEQKTLYLVTAEFLSVFCFVMFVEEVQNDCSGLCLLRLALEPTGVEERGITSVQSLKGSAYLTAVLLFRRPLTAWAVRPIFAHSPLAISLPPARRLTSVHSFPERGFKSDVYLLKLFGQVIASSYWTGRAFWRKYQKRYGNRQLRGMVLRIRCGNFYAYAREMKGGAEILYTGCLAEQQDNRLTKATALWRIRSGWLLSDHDAIFVCVQLIASVKCWLWYRGERRKFSGVGENFRSVYLATPVYYRTDIGAKRKIFSRPHVAVFLTSWCIIAFIQLSLQNTVPLRDGKQRTRSDAQPTRTVFLFARPSCFGPASAVLRLASDLEVSSSLPTEYRGAFVRHCRGDAALDVRASVALSVRSLLCHVAPKTVGALGATETWRIDSLIASTRKTLNLRAPDLTQTLWVVFLIKRYLLEELCARFGGLPRQPATLILIATVSRIRDFVHGVTLRRSPSEGYVCVREARIHEALSANPTGGCKELSPGRSTGVQYLRRHKFTDTKDKVEARCLHSQLQQCQLYFHLPSSCLHRTRLPAFKSADFTVNSLYSAVRRLKSYDNFLPVASTFPSDKSVRRVEIVRFVFQEHIQVSIHATRAWKLRDHDQVVCVTRRNVTLSRYPVQLSGWRFVGSGGGGELCGYFKATAFLEDFSAFEAGEHGSNKDYTGTRLGSVGARIRTGHKAARKAFTKIDTIGEITALRTPLPGNEVKQGICGAALPLRRDKPHCLAGTRSVATRTTDYTVHQCVVVTLQIFQGYVYSPEATVDAGSFYPWAMPLAATDIPAIFIIGCFLCQGSTGTYAIDVKHVYTEVDSTIGSQFIRNRLDDSEPIADVQETSSECHTARCESAFLATGVQRSARVLVSTLSIHKRELQKLSRIRLPENKDISKHRALIPYAVYSIRHKYPPCCYELTCHYYYTLIGKSPTLFMLPEAAAGHTHLHVFLVRCPDDKGRSSQCYAGLYRARSLVSSDTFTGRRGVSVTYFRKVLLQSRSCPGPMLEGVRRHIGSHITLRIKCVIASKRKALNWRAVFSSHCEFLWDSQRLP